MIKVIYFMVATLTLVLCSCNAKVEEQEQLQKEVYAIHDEVMPKMSEIHRLSRQLKSLAQDTTLTDPGTKQQIADAILQLHNADEGMMTWMNQFQQPGLMRSSKTHEQIMQYLRDEKIKIEQVKSDMLNSIEAAQALLKSLGK